jgi:hypothetical protein
MDEEFQELEATLKGLRPAVPDAACMDRLLAAVQGRLPAADPGVERELGRLRPAVPEAAASQRLLDAVSRVPFPVDEKVVLFPGKAKPATPAPARRPWIAAAAAVAVLGAFSALMMDGGSRQGTLPVAGTRRIETGTGAANPPGFVPAGIGSGVHDARDEGLTWTRDGKPLRRVKVIYMDKVKYRDEEGKIIEVERPRVETLLVPEKID